MQRHAMQSLAVPEEIVGRKVLITPRNGDKISYNFSEYQKTKNVHILIISQELKESCKYGANNSIHQFFHIFTACQKY